MSRTADSLSKRRCPHCGNGIEEALAMHMSRDCDAAGQEPEPLTLDDAPDTIVVDEDELQQRRDLADELAEEGTVLDSNP